MTEQNIVMKSQPGEEMGKESKKMILSFAKLQKQKSLSKICTQAKGCAANLSFDLG